MGLEKMLIFWPAAPLVQCGSSRANTSFLASQPPSKLSREQQPGNIPGQIIAVPNVIGEFGRIGKH